jgi:hypothetical protein
MTRICVPAYIIILVIGFTSGMPIIANADLVVGKVHPVPASHQFRVVNSQDQVVKETVRTDAQGNFEVTLPPGVYSAIADEGKASIRSSNRPLVGQSITFR